MYSSIDTGSNIISEFLIFAVPDDGDELPVKILIKVDFPAPLCPRIVNSSPMAISK
jgi:hypothetical protein